MRFIERTEGAYGQNPSDAGTAKTWTYSMLATRPVFVK